MSEDMTMADAALPAEIATGGEFSPPWMLGGRWLEQFEKTRVRNLSIMGARQTYFTTDWHCLARVSILLRFGLWTWSSSATVNKSRPSPLESGKDPQRVSQVDLKAGPLSGPWLVLYVVPNCWHIEGSRDARLVRSPRTVPIWSPPSRWLPLLPSNSDGQYLTL